MIPFGGCPVEETLTKGGIVRAGSYGANIAHVVHVAAPQPAIARVASNIAGQFSGDTTLNDLKEEDQIKKVKSVGHWHDVHLSALLNVA